MVSEVWRVPLRSLHHSRFCWAGTSMYTMLDELCVGILTLFVSSAFSFSVSILLICSGPFCIPVVGFIFMIMPFPFLLVFFLWHGILMGVELTLQCSFFSVEQVVEYAMIS